MPSAVHVLGDRSSVRRGSAHPLEVLAGLQPRPRAWRTSPGGPGARASRCSAPATSPTRPGTTTCARTCVPAEPGLFRLAPGARGGRRRAGCRPAVRARRARAVHALGRDLHDLQAGRPHPQGAPPDLPARPRRGRPVQHRARAGSATSARDGRPILGLDSRDLLEITLEASPDGFLVPAHIWTPWFSALGSKSGFDAIADCYADLAEHILAVETGLSLRPGDELAGVQSGRLPAGVQLGRALAAGAGPRGDPARPPSWTTSRSGDALRHRRRSAGTIEFFPEEGKYHADGHRACGVNWEPGADPRGRRRVPGVRQAAHGRACCTGSRSWPTGRTGYRPPGAPAGHPPDPAARDPRRDPRRRRRSPRRVDAAARPPWSPTLGSGAGHPARRCRSTRSTRVGGELLGEAHRPAAARRGAPRRPATTASTA